MKLLRERRDEVNGMLKGLSESICQDTVIDVMIAEAINTSQIEGQYLSRSDVVSSLRNQLGLNMPAESVRDLAARGAAALMVDVRESWQEGLSKESLCCLAQHDHERIYGGGAGGAVA